LKPGEADPVPITGMGKERFRRPTSPPRPAPRPPPRLPLRPLLRPPPRREPREPRHRPRRRLRQWPPARRHPPPSRPPPFRSGAVVTSSTILRFAASDSRTFRSTGSPARSTPRDGSRPRPRRARRARSPSMSSPRSTTTPLSCTRVTVPLHSTPGANRCGDSGPGIVEELLDPQGDPLLLRIDVEDHDLDLLPLLHDLGGMLHPRVQLMSETWTRPSMPGSISTKAPKDVRLRTFPARPFRSGTSSGGRATDPPRSASSPARSSPPPDRP
jgi:hypothetical protein